MAPDERRRRLEELRTELSKLRTMISAGGSVENPGRVKALRRTVAKVLTVMREDELRA
ncbi:MAG: 50S ribosomal protein L29 [Candidatus Bathyarchaeota archaeon]|nr:50S ribosomal protein L29 [Candidatus Bathyarchaeota archaeon]